MTPPAPAFLPAAPIARNSRRIGSKRRIPAACAQVPDGEQSLLSQATSSHPQTRLRALLATRNLPLSVAEPILHAIYDKPETNPHNRAYLALFLGRRKTHRASTILNSLAENDTQPSEVRSSAIAGLGHLRDPSAIPLCLRLLRTADWCIRASAAVAVGMIAEENGDVSQLVYDDLHCALTEAVASEDFALMLACIGALADVGDQRAVPLIIPHLQSPDFPTAQVAAEALGRLGTTAARDALVRVTESDAHVNVLWAAELALKNDFTSSAN